MKMDSSIPWNKKKKGKKYKYRGSSNLCHGSVPSGDITYISPLSGNLNTITCDKICSKRNLLAREQCNAVGQGRGKPGCPT